MQKMSLKHIAFSFARVQERFGFATELGLHTHELSLNNQEAVKHCMGNLDDDSIKLFCYTMWQLWKARNETVIQNKKFNPVEVTKKAMYWMHGVENNEEGNQLFNITVPKGVYSYHSEGWQVIIDGSWDTMSRAGCAHVIYCDGEMPSIGYSFHTLQYPFHAEVMALKEALIHLKEMMQHNQTRCVTLFSDCQNMVATVNERDTEDLPAWMALQDVHDVMLLMDQTPQPTFLIQVSRCAVHQAHILANNARVTGERFKGRMRPHHHAEKKLLRCLDTSYSQRVPEALP